jgi:hypothetical protein
VEEAESRRILLEAELTRLDDKRREEEAVLLQLEDRKQSTETEFQKYR